MLTRLPGPRPPVPGSHLAPRIGESSTRRLRPVGIVLLSVLAAASALVGVGYPTVAAAAGCGVPAADVVVQPGQNLAALATSRDPGTTFRLAPGVHRTGSVKPKDGQRFLGTPSATCRRLSILDGSVAVTGWRRVARGWAAPTPVPHGDVVAARCTAHYSRCNHPNDLYLADIPLRHVSVIDHVAPGTWFFDYPNHRLVVGSNPTGQRLEIGSHPLAISSYTATDVVVAGLVIQKYASPASGGAIGAGASGPRWLIADNEIRLNHAAGASAGADTRVRDNYVHHNGQIGLKVRGDRARITGNLLELNNYANFLRTYEAGGVKSTANDVVLTGNCVANNEGAGMWADVGSQRTVFTGNTVFGNWSQGIFFEISTGAVISHNRVGDNGRRGDWLYGAQIMVSTSSRSTVFANVVEVGRSYGNGITVIWQNRGAGRQAIDNVVAANDVTYLAGRGVSGLGADVSSGFAVYNRNQFRDNQYHTPTPGARHFRGSTGLGTFSDMQRLRQESRSTIDRVVRPRAWNCDRLRASVGH